MPSTTQVRCNQDNLQIPSKALKGHQELVGKVWCPWLLFAMMCDLQQGLLADANLVGT